MTAGTNGGAELLSIDVEHEAGRADARVRVHGEVDAMSVGELAAALERLVASGATDMAVDLSDVPFIDSTGINALITTNGQLVGRGRVVIEAASPPVRRTFTIAGLDAYFALE